jgi:hypothetical protein
MLGPDAAAPPEDPRPENDPSFGLQRENLRLLLLVGPCLYLRRLQRVVVAGG